MMTILRHLGCARAGHGVMGDGLPEACDRVTVFDYPIESSLALGHSRGKARSVDGQGR